MRGSIPNPSVRGGSRPAVTDRALRYRAHANPPPGPRICHYCGAAGRVDIEHVDGHEEHGNPENLGYACRSCNATKGAAFARQGIGRLTKQYNPTGAATPAQWHKIVASLMGLGPLSIAAAIAQAHATPHARRASFATAKNPKQPAAVPTFEQYRWAVTQHRVRGAHDEAGKIIHATPPELRSEYARRLAANRNTTTKRSSDEVPF